MHCKSLFLGLINILFIFNLSFAQGNLDNIVPPIQYPEKKNDEMQFRKEIKNSFYKSDDLINNLNSQDSKINNDTSNAVIKDNSSDINNQKSFEELMGQNITKKKSDSKKNSNITLKESENQGRPSELWKVFLISTLFVSIIGFLGFLLTRFRKKGMFSITKAEKMMDVVSTLSISPKRQVMIIRIRDQEIVVSNTETGINFLTELGGSFNNRSMQDKKQVQISDKFLLPKNEKSILDKMEQQTSMTDRAPEKISDILLKALKSINSNSLNQKKSISSEQNSNVPQNKSEGFPKYLANQFENESKKEIKKKEEDVDSVENVTNLIREKLRSMKPLN